jgi:hypothetical protein
MTKNELCLDLPAVDISNINKENTIVEKRMADNSNPYIPMASTFQDLERLKFAQNLRSNPAEYSAYVNERVNTLSDEVFNHKRVAFQKAQIDLGRYMDMDHNANFYKIRSDDVNRLSGAMDINNARIQQSLEHDKVMTKRQFEINEWYNYNKLETLFFLQVFFISALLLAIIVFLQKNSLVSNAMSALLTGALCFVVAVTGLYRYYYTQHTRDTRLWNRRYFGSAAAPNPVAKCAGGGDMEIDINKLIPKEFTQCADDAAIRFSGWQDNLEKEMLAFDETGATPSRISGDKSLGGLICENLNQG